MHVFSSESQRIVSIQAKLERRISVKPLLSRVWCAAIRTFSEGAVAGMCITTSERTDVPGKYHKLVKCRENARTNHSCKR